MNKIVGLDIGENSVKMAYFAGRELKRTAKLELPDAMVSGGRSRWTRWRTFCTTRQRETASR